MRFAKPGPYTTSLNTNQEALFQHWVAGNQSIGPVKSWSDREHQNPATNDYDMRGYWQDIAQQGQSQIAANGHFPDTYKTPYHQSFSVESKYALPYAPFWWNNKLVGHDGTVYFDETPAPE